MGANSHTNQNGAAKKENTKDDSNQRAKQDDKSPQKGQSPLLVVCARCCCCCWQSLLSSRARKKKPAPSWYKLTRTNSSRTIHPVERRKERRKEGRKETSKQRSKQCVFVCERLGCAVLQKFLPQGTLSAAPKGAVMEVVARFLDRIQALSHCASRNRCSIPSLLKLQCYLRSWLALVKTTLVPAPASRIQCTSRREFPTVEGESTRNFPSRSFVYVKQHA